ncbi:MAG TPA: hypothetical protein VMQ65_03055 [Candidatus Limnocylindria bacterium]|nr:hypothetical protein [Candidatus Limnocylindria bacterium]
MAIQRFADVGRLAASLFRRERRVPDLTHAVVAFRPYTDDVPTGVALASAAFLALPDDPAHEDGGVTVVSDVDALRAALVQRIEAFIAPAIAPLSARSHLGEKALWGLAGYGALVSVAEAYAADGRPETGARELDALYVHATRFRLAPSTAEIVTVDEEAHLVLCLGACCRMYLWPGGREKCAACPLRGRDDRIAQQLQPDGEREPRE